MYKGDCYPDGSYFWDSNVNDNDEELECVLPNTTLTTGQWVKAEGEVTTGCSSGSNSGPFNCDPATSPATLRVRLSGSLGASQEGFYKCCLPTSCSDSNTNVITANIFSKCYVYKFVTSYYVNHRICTDIILYC